MIWFLFALFYSLKKKIAELSWVDSSISSRYFFIIFRLTTWQTVRVEKIICQLMCSPVLPVQFPTPCRTGRRFFVNWCFLPCCVCSFRHHGGPCHLVENILSADLLLCSPMLSVQFPTPWRTVWPHLYRASRRTPVRATQIRRRLPTTCRAWLICFPLDNWCAHRDQT